jgi:hypothetical protein
MAKMKNQYFTHEYNNHIFYDNEKHKSNSFFSKRLLEKPLSIIIHKQKKKYSTVPIFHFFSIFLSQNLDFVVYYYSSSILVPKSFFLNV